LLINAVPIPRNDPSSPETIAGADNRKTSAPINHVSMWIKGAVVFIKQNSMWINMASVFIKQACV
jgi:hypothetical protein